jgi:hypothetical protein
VYSANTHDVSHRNSVCLNASGLQYVGCVWCLYQLIECRSTMTWKFGLHVHTHVDSYYFLSLAVGYYIIIVYKDKEIYFVILSN